MFDTLIKIILRKTFRGLVASYNKALQPYLHLIWTWHTERMGICLYPEAG